MDAGTTNDMIEDLMVELAIVRSELFLMTKYRDHYATIATGLYEGAGHDECYKYELMYEQGCGEPDV